MGINLRATLRSVKELVKMERCRIWDAEAATDPCGHKNVMEIIPAKD